MKYLYLALTFLLFACSGEVKNEKWSFDHFQFDETAIEGGTELTILYQGPWKMGDKGTEAYIHYVVINSQGDTVNVITPILNNLVKPESTDQFYFEKKGSTMYNAITSGTELSQEREEIVYRDRNNDDIADNSFPAIIGIITTK